MILTFCVAFSVVAVIVVIVVFVSAIVVEGKPGHGAAPCRRVGATVDNGVEVVLAEQSVVAALTELVPGYEPPLTDDALEALDVVDPVPGSHHQVVLGE